MKKQNEAYKMKRLLRLIQFLSSPRTVEECAEKIEADKRTIYRYIKLLVEVDFSIEKMRTGTVVTYQIIEKKSKDKEIFEVSRIASEMVTPTRRYSNIVEILDSPFLRKKPFIEAIYGEYNSASNSKFRSKITQYRNDKFNQEEIEKVVAVLENIKTAIYFALS